ncbi:MAG: homoserine dehydrogenase [Bacilli bacterium]|nr:homoserine dehydrogenase [Bacilli bacterium]
MTNLRIGLLGYGIVGKGVFSLVNSQPGMSVVKVFDIPAKKDVLRNLLVTDFKEITESEDVDIVIECLGGDDLPYQAIISALKNGKHVLSSNKETIANHFEEYMTLAKEHNVSFLCEAAVGGGIPLLHNVVEIARFDTIYSFIGLLNGTCNFILTRLTKDKYTFAQALKEAQDRGFAEKDYRADLSGADLLRKGRILASLAFHKDMDYKTIPSFGIENINDEIFESVSKLGRILKFGVFGYYKDGTLCVMSVPFLFKPNHALSTLDYEFNGVLLECKNNSTIEFIGKGAGSLPTASAIMQDLMHFQRGGSRIDMDDMSMAKVVFVKGEEYYVYQDGVGEIIRANSVEELKKYKFIAKIVD